MDIDKLIENEIEKSYFKGLLSKKKEKQRTLKISTKEGPTNLYPTAIAPSNLLEKLPYSSYESIREKYKSDDRLEASIWLRKMHGGIGSSITRLEYLNSRGRKKLGAKGTDLFIPTSKGEISIAEAQIVQASKKLKSFANVYYQDILNVDVQNIFDDIWSKVEAPGVKRFDALIQNNLPTLDENDELTLDRKAPAGHGLFGYEVLHSIFDESLRPKEPNLICCIGNGEDLSSTPDKSVVNWMLQEEIPICMLTTTKTSIDQKGGQIALEKEGDDIFITIIEKAQAEHANQLKLFSNLGLRKEDKEAFFNTNVVLLNIDVLVKLFKDANKEEILKNSLPDLIQNKKKQNSRTFTQLEGAMGSVFLNLDRYWRKKYGKGLIHIMNVSTKNRTKFFSPIKTAFDFFMQYHSDRFSFNEDTYHLVNNNPGNLPFISLPDDYADLSKVLEDFRGASLIELDSLVIKNRVPFEIQKFSGSIEI